MYKYFNKVIYDDKEDLNSSLKKLKDITKSNVFLIFEDNEKFLKKQYRGKELKAINLRLKNIILKQAFYNLTTKAIETISVIIHFPSGSPETETKMNAIIAAMPTIFEI